MKLKNHEVVDILRGINDIQAEQVKNLKENPNYPRYPLKVSYALNRNKGILSEVHEVFGQSFNELVAENNLEVNDEGYITLGTEEERKNNPELAAKVDSFIKSLDELNNIVNEVELHTISIEDFGSYNPTELEMSIFMKMIAE